GLAFQVADDLLDVEASAADVGKRTHKDEARGKATYPSLLGVARSRELARQLAEQACRALKDFDEKAAPLRALFGDEFAGTVAEVGDDVAGFKVGDALMAAPTAPCGACFYCARGDENLCAQAMSKMVLGGYADYLLIGAHVVARNAFHKPAGLPFEEAALLEPLSCVVHAHAMALPQPFETVLVIGAGAFGLLHTMVLKALGVRQVVVAGRGAQRLQWAGELGADRVIDARSADVVAATAALNGGYGPDLVIECTGQVPGWADAFARVRRG